MEEWKDVKGFENRYKISNKGNCWSQISGKMMKPVKDTNGYLFVNLKINGKSKHCSIHRLVAEAFIPNPDNLPEVNHKDENKSNPYVENLEWCDHTYNMMYNERHKKVGKKLHNRKDKSKKVYQYTLDNKLVNIWGSTMEIERELKICHTNVIQCCNGGFNLHEKWINKKTTKGYKWSYTPL